MRQQIAEPLQRAEVGGDRDVDLGDLEEGVGRGDAQVAGAGEVDAGANAAAMDRGDHRRPRRLDRAERVLQPFDVPQPGLGGAAGIVAGRELARRIFEVEPGGEMLALPRQQDGADRGIAAERAERVADRGEHVAVHRVQFVRPRQLDVRDPFLHSQLDPVARHRRSFRFETAPPASRLRPMTSFTVNGQPVHYRMDPETPLLWALRDATNLTGTKFGCGTGHCGACTVHVDGNAVRSCRVRIADIEGSFVTTIEVCRATARIRSSRPSPPTWCRNAAIASRA